MEDQNVLNSASEPLKLEAVLEKSPQKPDSNGEDSANLFPESPVYDPEDSGPLALEDENITNDEKVQPEESKEDKGDQQGLQMKRKHSSESNDSASKIQKLENSEEKVSTETLDAEVSEITGGAKRKIEDILPSTSRVRTPAKNSPRKLTKRSNSTETPKTPKTPKSRPASTDITKQRKTPRKIELDLLAGKIPEEIHISSSVNTISRPSIEFVKEMPGPKASGFDAIEEESSELNDSQNFHLVLSPSLDDEDNSDKNKAAYNSDPVTVKDRKEVLIPGKVHETHSDGYTYSDQDYSQPPRSRDSCKEKDKATDQESTDSMGDMAIDSPDHIPRVTSKLISKLSNGNSSTPTDNSNENKLAICLSDNDSDATPDMLKLNGKKSNRGKIESFRVSNTTTPSTISPLQNGHSLPINTPQIPTFDVHISHNEDGEFLSLYIVKTDNDLGMDMYKEYQRFSKRFTIDPYLGDVSTSNSPSSVTSACMINLPNRTSFASTTSSTSTSSTRTSDGNFVVPQPPRKSVSHPSSTTVKGCEALLKKVQDIFSHIRDSTMDESNRTADDKISVGIQASPSGSNISNGNASPEEVSKCDKATPKSSLKKSRVRGRRPLAGKTKRAILPTQVEEPEYMHGMNSPEMVPNNSENGNMSPNSKDDKPLSSLVATPKSVNKLKQKKSRPTSPRPATPVEKLVPKQEYPGYPPNTVVLAKWVDKRYYSGKVIEITEPNKYMIKFDDGQTKTLLDDFIIFGNLKSLPLQGQSVYAMVDEDQNYEPGLVLGVDENSSGTIMYRCTTDGDTTVMVTASELYLTEDQARSIIESARPKSPATPTTPRRRGLRELDLDNIIQGPRSARSRDKGSSSARKRMPSPKSPKASTSGVSRRPVARSRVLSESSSVSEGSSAPQRIEEVAGVEPEVQRTPRKIDGVKAGPLQLKGAAKQNIGKKNSKLTKFENDADTISLLGPIPPKGSTLFEGLHFLLTCTEPPVRSKTDDKSQDSRHYWSEEDGDSSSAVAVTDTEDLSFGAAPYHKERLREQLEAGGGIVYSHFDDVPSSKYNSCRLLAPRPCHTAKYISSLAGGIRPLAHDWVVHCCQGGKQRDQDAYLLPAGWSLVQRRFVNWAPPSGKRNTTFFKDKLILLCGEPDPFVKFWERVCTLAGANTRVVNEEELNMTGAIALVTEWDCPHEVQNKANQDNIPMVSTTWVVQCLIEAKVIAPTSHDKFSFMYTEPE